MCWEFWLKDTQCGGPKAQKSKDMIANHLDCEAMIVTNFTPDGLAIEMTGRAVLHFATLLTWYYLSCGASRDV